jgi:hypothetical protein
MTRRTASVTVPSPAAICSLSQSGVSAEVLGKGVRIDSQDWHPHEARWETLIAKNESNCVG